MKSNILIVDDEERIRSFFQTFLSKKGYFVYTAAMWKEAEKLIYTVPLDLIILDLQLPGKNGLDILDEVKKKFPLLEIIIFSGKPNIMNAVEAIKKGAFDFVEKSDSIEKIITIIENALKLKGLKEENLVLKKIKKKDVKELIGNSKIIKKVREEITIAAKTDAGVLITGENGTGKQIVAENIHSYSFKSSGNFIDINCAAIPENLLESELFGYEKGAFTGAVYSTKGKFELANNGSLFLDEIGELPLTLQAKLLKVLESKSFSRLGSTEVIQLNTRIVAATNIDIENEIEKNHFRKDLFYRLNVIHIHLPPLRERIEDIPVLITAFLKEIGKEEKSFSNSAIEFLLKYSWPGNIRELRNIVERAVIMTTNKKIIERSDLENYLSFNEKKESSEPREDLTLKKYIGLKEKEYIERILKKYPTQKEVSQILDIDRTVLYRKIKKYGI
ncbi:MAG TPA: Fis family transcriptional regulator [Spirochaetia bacterium]|nr:MAG: hypothetical protein A2Y41_04960 [Spirochaetes bacterium GWB1_36_13]HCL57048.1 Fis family transcriptional regulator [Spirochaetia bacterium]